MLVDTSTAAVETRSAARVPHRRVVKVRGLWVPVAMFLAVALVATAAYWDEERESRAALEDFAQEQSILASAAAAGLSNRLTSAVRDAAIIAQQTSPAGAPSSLIEAYSDVRVRSRDQRSTRASRPSSEFVLTVPLKDSVVDLAVTTANLMGGLSTLERPSSVRLLVLPPGEETFHTTDARLLQSDVLRSALDEGRPSVRLTRDQSSLLGLPRRTALAGLARLDAGALGAWGVAVVASAERERDREMRASFRLVLGVLIAAGLVLGFGSVALRKQHGELVLERELAVAELSREGDERLLRANRAATMGTLAIGLAHELSTPLGIIVGRVEQLLPRVTDDERAQRSLTIVLEQAARIEKVIRGFLDLARGGVPSLKRLSPLDIVSGAMSLVEHRYTKSNVSLTVDAAGQLPTVSCDLGLMEHALVNLLLNSCDACDSGGSVHIQVTVGAGTVTFCVDDDGQGITEADAARATEPFFTTKAVGHGTGLGLAIANEIIKSHRGSLSIGPRSPRGTHACLMLPEGDGGKA
jgi:two-component system NtrC family sensor kinase